MADNSKQAFDFDAAVAAARSDYPVETRDTTFVDLTKQDAEQQIRDWYTSLNASGLSKSQIASKAKEAARKNGFMRVYTPPGKKLVGVSPVTKSKYLGSKDVAAEARFAFNHELGHAVVSFGFTNAGSPVQELARAEIAADVFAILRGIGEGSMTREQARHVSVARAMQAPGSHTTSQAIDAMLDENSDAEIKALTPYGVREFAARYAAVYMPKPGELEDLAKKLQWVRAEDFVPPPPASEGLKGKLKAMFNKIKGFGPKSAKAAQGQVVMVFLDEQEWIRNVAEVFNTAAKGTVASHVSEKILTAAFNGEVPGRKFDLTGKQWEEVKKNLSSHNPHHNGP